VWRSYYEKLLNEECDWNHKDIGEGIQYAGAEEVIVFKEQEVREAIRKMKGDKAAGPTGVVS
jgi:hypothetical protein